MSDERKVAKKGYFHCHMPTRVIFGPGRLSEIGDVCREFGKKVLLFSDPFLKKVGLTERVIGYLKKEGLGVTTYDTIKSNPLCTSVDEAAGILKEEKCDFVIALGGGSTIDTAKAAVVVASNGGKSWDYVWGSDHEPVSVTDVSYSIITIPTTSGTGSEVTPWIVISNPALKGQKAAFGDYRLVAKVSVVDPELMVSMPPALTASTGIDVLSHTLEAYVNVNATPLANMLALDAIKLAAENLPTAFGNGNNLEARAKMAWADVLAGWTISHAGTGLPHAMGMAAGGLYDIPHGVSIAPCLAKWMEFSLASSLNKFASVAEAMDNDVKNMPLRKKAEKSSELVKQLLKDVALDVTFSDLRVTENDIDYLVEVVYTRFGGDVESCPRKPTREEVAELYRQCL